jgi:excisionase family DNA binding protein
MTDQTEIFYWRVDGLAARWRVSTRTVRRLIENGQLRAVRIGGRLRVASDVVERYEARHEVQPPTLSSVSKVSKS